MKIRFLKPAQSEVDDAFVWMILGSTNRKQERVIEDYGDAAKNNSQAVLFACKVYVIKDQPFQREYKLL